MKAGMAFKLHFLHQTWWNTRFFDSEKKSRQRRRKGDADKARYRSCINMSAVIQFFIKVHLFVRGRIESMPLNLEIMSNVLQ